MPFPKRSVAQSRSGRKMEALVKRAARAQGGKCVEVLAAVRDDERVAPEVRAQAAIRIR